MHRSAALVVLLGGACGPTTHGHGRASQHTRDPAPADRRVHFVDSMGLLGCGWADADEIIRRAMVPLAPELDLCAASQGDDAVNWSIVVQVGPRGRVKEAGFSSLLDGAEPPECALEVLAGTRFESGPPTCGAVHWLRFKVDADRGCAGAS